MCDEKRKDIDVGGGAVGNREMVCKCEDREWNVWEVTI